MALPSPWRRLRALPHVSLVWHEKGPMGWCQHSTQIISLRSNLTQAEKRGTLVHELEHLRAGPSIMGYEREDETAVRLRTARWLIPLPNLADALVWAMDDVEAADLLWVDIGVVQDRLVGLSRAESDELNRRLDHAEVTFPKL